MLFIVISQFLFLNYIHLGPLIKVSISTIIVLMNSKLLWRGGILGVLIGFGELSLYTNIGAFD